MESALKIVLINFIISIMVALIILPILKRLKVGQIEREYGPRSHLIKQGTPTMGGIIIAITLIISICILCSNMKILIPLGIIIIGFGVVGFIDDFKKLIFRDTEGLKPAYKMLGLLAISVIFALFLIKAGNGTEILIPGIKTIIKIPIILYIPFIIFVMLAATNAVNLTDGIDGLASSVSMIMIAGLSVIAMKYEVYEIAMLGFSLCGACLGFLIFNLHPAKIFMGDTGSLLLGGAIVVMALYLKMPLILPIIAIVPVMETISVIMQVAYFKRTGNRIFKMTPLHHHFELSGWKEGKIVSIFSVITLVFCVVAIFLV